MKKKKKSIHLRRIRQRSENKSIKQDIETFFNMIIFYFTKKKSFCSFLLCFKAFNFIIIKNIFKKYGLSLGYRFGNINKNIEVVYTYIKKNYSKLRYNKFIKNRNVYKKKNLFLHVSYRHYLKLPVRGQRTKTNAKTRKHYAII